jgi:hypothetical protein
MGNVRGRLSVDGTIVNFINDYVKLFLRRAYIQSAEQFLTLPIVLYGCETWSLALGEEFFVCLCISMRTEYLVYLDL